MQSILTRTFLIGWSKSKICRAQAQCTNVLPRTVERRGTLIVLLVTETSDGGYWVQVEGNYAWAETAVR